MKYYADFYKFENDRWVYQCGDRAIIRLDGRLSLANMKRVAEEEGARRGYDGYRIGRGNNLLDLFWITANVYWCKGKPSESEPTELS